VVVLDRDLTDGLVRLRPVVPADGAAIFAALSTDPSVSRWTRVPWPYTKSHLQEFMHAVDIWHAGQSDLALTVVDAATDDFLGCFGLHRIGRPEAPRSAFLADEVGYWVKEDARGRGVATRALRLLVRYAIVDLHRPIVNLQTKVGNTASATVAERAGFRFVGRVFGRDVDDDDTDHDRYVLTAADLDVSPTGPTTTPVSRSGP
jgi:RimJ/RimL family protein N-acetyltransferase